MGSRTVVMSKPNNCHCCVALYAECQIVLVKLRECMPGVSSGSTAWPGPIIEGSSGLAVATVAVVSHLALRIQSGLPTEGTEDQALFE